MIFFYLIDTCIQIYFDFQYLPQIKFRAKYYAKKSCIIFLIKEKLIKILIIQPQVYNYNSED